MKPGETVLVNAAAGAVGSVVGQIAKIGVSALDCSCLQAMHDEEGKHPCRHAYSGVLRQHKLLRI